ncbi:unnamed protein product [Arctia plantaginis]|uniref:Uncharacterized protein n=1 Tax=Arctia plantaginis TaxID=874455 RepID=A0A8S1AYL7_ARCPL|nr:unnamed protein product [Arctia plantaginis]
MLLDEVMPTMRSLSPDAEDMSSHPKKPRNIQEFKGLFGRKIQLDNVLSDSITDLNPDQETIECIEKKLCVPADSFSTSLNKIEKILLGTGVYTEQNGANNEWRMNSLI